MKSQKQQAFRPLMSAKNLNFRLYFKFDIIHKQVALSKRDLLEFLSIQNLMLKKTI